MNWEALGAIGEIVGAVAVVVTLGYLAVQIRQNTLMMKATIRQDLCAAAQEGIHKWAENSEVMVKKLGDGDLDPAESFRASQMVRAMFRGYENYVYQLGLGLFEASEWEGIRETFRATLSSASVQRQWRRTRSEYSQALQDVVDRLLAEGLEPPGPAPQQ